MRLRAFVVSTALLAGATLAAVAFAAPVPDAAPMDSLSDVPPRDGPPVPPRMPSTATGSSLADLIAALRGRGPLSPSDEDAMLREEIIRGTLELATRPPIPAAVRTRYERAIKPGKRKPAPEQTLRELAFVLGEAPWWPEPYLAIASIEESLGHLESATIDLELYLVARPAAKDWRSVRTRLRALRTRMLGPQ